VRQESSRERFVKRCHMIAEHFFDLKPALEYHMPGR
jgi:hypothetical protein